MNKYIHKSVSKNTKLIKEGLNKSIFLEKRF